MVTLCPALNVPALGPVSVNAGGAPPVITSDVVRCD